MQNARRHNRSTARQLASDLAVAIGSDLATLQLVIRVVVTKLHTKALYNALHVFFAYSFISMQFPIQFSQISNCCFNFGHLRALFHKFQVWSAAVNVPSE